MKIGLGMMVKNFVSEEVLSEFLDNAAKYGHNIHEVVVVYSNELDKGAAGRLAKRTRLNLVKLNEYEKAESAFKKLNMPAKASDHLLHCRIIREYGITPYGFNRNTVLIEALLSELDLLIFIDSDVYPYVLQYDETGEVVKEEIDFIGRHLQGINAGAAITTSDYSGYNILPPADFDGMDELLYGLRKEGMLHFWRGSSRHKCLSLQRHEIPEPFPTKKLLGGNLGILLEALPKIPPFFSPYYFYEGRPFLARGEDTMMGLAAAGGGLRCLDIDTHIFHNTFGSYPQVPDLASDPVVQERFYFACTGWIGRNVFQRWERGHRDTGSDHQTKSLAIGAKALYEYTGNRLFQSLPEIDAAAKAALPDMIGQYEEAKQSWSCFLERWFTK
ncbi:MAG: hypothetical protein Q4C25_05765 [Bacillota bacterium]|nr:hypothetical protein [Bacillota bacterium]